MRILPCFLAIASAAAVATPAELTALPLGCSNIVSQPGIWHTLANTPDHPPSMFLRATLRGNALRLTLSKPSVYADVAYDTDQCSSGLLRVKRILDIGIEESITDGEVPQVEMLKSLLSRVSFLEYRSWGDDSLVMWINYPNQKGINFNKVPSAF